MVHPFDQGFISLWFVLFLITTLDAATKSTYYIEYYRDFKSKGMTKPSSPVTKIALNILLYY